jgi:hypothetical protein
MGLLTQGRREAVSSTADQSSTASEKDFADPSASDSHLDKNVADQTSAIADESAEGFSRGPAVSTDPGVWLEIVKPLRSDELPRGQPTNETFYAAIAEYLGDGNMTADQAVEVVSRYMHPDGASRGNDGSSINHGRPSSSRESALNILETATQRPSDQHWQSNVRLALGRVRTELRDEIRECSNRIRNQSIPSLDSRMANAMNSIYGGGATDQRVATELAIIMCMMNLNAP